MNIRRCSWAGVLAIALVPAMANADLIASAEIVGPSGSPNRITVPYSGMDQAFTFDVYLTTNFDTSAAQMVIQSLSGSGIFSITNVTFDSAAGWGDWPVPSPVADPWDPDWSEPWPDAMTHGAGGDSSVVIGSLTYDSYLAAGTTRFMTVEAVVHQDVVPGSYYLNLADIIVGQYPDSLEVAGTAGTMLEVQVLAIPAPSAVWLGGFGLTMAVWLRRRSGVAAPAVIPLTA